MLKVENMIFILKNKFLRIYLDSLFIIRCNYHNFLFKARDINHGQDTLRLSMEQSSVGLERMVNAKTRLLSMTVLGH